MAYLSWSFLKMGEKAERRTAFLFLLMAGVPVLVVAFFAFVAGMAAILYALRSAEGKDAERLLP